MFKLSSSTAVARCLSSKASYGHPTDSYSPDAVLALLKARFASDSTEFVEKSNTSEDKEANRAVTAKQAARIARAKLEQGDASPEKVRPSILCGFMHI